MAGSNRRFLELRDASVGEVRRFATLLQEALPGDFDSTFYNLKTQKLLLRSRSLGWISSLEIEMCSWLEHASLKGKQKAQLRRHFTICKAIQELLDIIDGQSSVLRIWQAPTEGLVRALFAWLEEERLKQEFEEETRRRDFSDSVAPLRWMELSRRSLRSKCDYVTRILGQISLLGVKRAAAIEPSPADIKDAMLVAAVDDLILHVLDCYTYKNFRISVEDKRVELHGLKTQTEEALTWSSLRARSRDLADVDPFVQVLHVEALARSLSCDCSSFPDFLQSQTGVQIFQALEQVSNVNNRLLKRDVVDLIDLDFGLKTRDGVFKIEELFDCWSLLYQIALSAYLWKKVFQRTAAPILPVSQLLQLATTRLGSNEEVGKRLLSQFSLDPAERNQDPFFRPLIKLNEEERLIAGIFLETGRFGRNLFTIAIREGGVNFAAKGLKPLRILHQEFTEAGYVARINVPIRAGLETITDVDIAAAKDGFLFIGQTKVLINPDSVYDDWKVLENLKNAARQLDRSLIHISAVAQAFGLADGEYLTVPFLLTNVWDFTGSTVGGFKVVDFSYLSFLLRGAELWKLSHNPPMREIEKLIAGRYPTGGELSRFLLRPIHEDMFQRPLLRRRSFPVGDWTVVIPIDVSKGFDRDSHEELTQEDLV